MNLQRRNFMRLGAGTLSLAASGLLLPLRALASTNTLEGAFKAKSVEDVFKALGSTPKPSELITLSTPDIAENGAVVPVSIVSKLPKTEQIMVLVEKNPNPMAASFTIPDGTEGSINTRVKVSQTCNVYAIVKADGQYYSAMRETKVTLGGCGG